MANMPGPWPGVGVSTENMPGQFRGTGTGWPAGHRGGAGASLPQGGTAQRAPDSFDDEHGAPALPAELVDQPATSAVPGQPPAASRWGTPWPTGSAAAPANAAYARGSKGRHKRRKSRRLGGWLRERRMLAVVGGLSLACTLLGGVAGGIIAVRSLTGATSPGYSLGSVPPAIANRPAASVAGIAARVLPSVVTVKVDGSAGTGSGFVISGGYIVTDNHVVTLDGEVTHATIQVIFSGGKVVRGQLVGRDPYADIAVIKPMGVSNLPSLRLGNSSGVEVGDPVIAVGSPLGLAGTVTSGIVSAIDRPVQPVLGSGSVPQVFFEAIQTDAPINPGNSGGPLVNARGQVIGVDAAIDTLGGDPLTGSQGGNIGLGFAIPINQARRVVVELIRTGHSDHAVIGASISMGYPGPGAQIIRAGHSGPSPVTAGGPAAHAGLRPGDVITRVNGLPIANPDGLLDAIRSLPPHQRIKLTFVRAGQTFTVTLRLGSAPS